MAIKRLNYFDHQFLIEADFTAQQDYHLFMRRHLNHVLHTFGIAEGLEVSKTANKAVTVKFGTAIDRDGREMLLEANKVIDLSDPTQFPAGATVHITAAYKETPSDQSTATGAAGNTRITEEAIILATRVAPATGGTVIRLATFKLDESANVPGNINDSLDGGVRQRVTPRAGLGLLSLHGVNNPGGNIDLLQTQSIVITPDDANNRITIGENHSVRTDNPHITTAAQVGAFTSLAGVSNAGGNIDLVEINSIVLRPEDANNRIVIGENHSGRTDNPHSTTAAQVGAMLASDYDLRRRSLANLTFTSENKDKETIITLGFQPKVVIVVGTVTAKLSGAAHSGGIGGFAFLENERMVQRCFGTGASRQSATDWVSVSVISKNICNALFIDNSVAPRLGENLAVGISSVNEKGMVAAFTRSAFSAGHSPIPGFSIDLQLMCMG